MNTDFHSEMKTLVDRLDKAAATDDALDPPSDESQIYVDDRFIGDASMSSTVLLNLYVALEHAQSFQLIYETKGEEMPCFVGYTILRNSLEASAKSLWLTNDESREERLSRLVKLLGADVYNEGQAMDEIRHHLSNNKKWQDLLSEFEAKEFPRYQSVSSRFAEKLQTIQNVYPSINAKNAEKTTSVIKQVGQAFYGVEDRLSALLWRVSSGVSHSNGWAISRMARKTIQGPAANPRYNSYTIAPDLPMIVSMFRGSLDLLESAQNTYIKVSSFAN